MSLDVLRDLGRIARALDSISNIEFKKCDLAKGQYLYLVRISENPGILLGQLCEMICVDKATGSRAVNKLVKHNLVEKKLDNQNKKNLHLYLTAAGKKIYPMIDRENKYSNQVALQGFSKEEIKQFKDFLQRSQDNVVKDWKQVKHGKIRKY